MNEIGNELTEIVTDLIRINDVRIDCYCKMAIETGSFHNELKHIFQYKADKIQQSNDELLGLLTEADGAAIASRPTGKIFQKWNRSKKMMYFKDRKAILSFCECGEEAALEAYKSALISKALHPVACRVIMDQKYSLQSSHNQIKKYLDLQELAY